MTSTNPVPATAVPAADKACATNTSKVSKTHLRASSEAHKEPEKTSVSANTRKRTGKPPSTTAPTISAASAASAEKPRQTKAAVVEALLTREGGSSLGVLCDATGWQTHTCRAFLTGLRKKGKEVIRGSDKEGKSIYLIAPNRSPAPSPAADPAETEAR